jgi:hypothetical protein
MTRLGKCFTGTSFYTYQCTTKKNIKQTNGISDMERILSTVRTLIEDHYCETSVNRNTLFEGWSAREIETPAGVYTRRLRSCMHWHSKMMYVVFNDGFLLSTVMCPCPNTIVLNRKTYLGVTLFVLIVSWFMNPSLSSVYRGGQTHSGKHCPCSWR